MSSWPWWCCRHQLKEVRGRADRAEQQAEEMAKLLENASQPGRWVPVTNATVPIIKLFMLSLAPSLGGSGLVVCKPAGGGCVLCVDVVACCVWMWWWLRVVWWVCCRYVVDLVREKDRELDRMRERLADMEHQSRWL